MWWIVLHIISSSFNQCYHVPTNQQNFEKKFSYIGPPRIKVIPYSKTQCRPKVREMIKIEGSFSLTIEQCIIILQILSIEETSIIWRFSFIELAPPVDVCSEPKPTCKGYLTRWYYNSYSSTCEQFTGCKGNGNNFYSRMACLRQCRKKSCKSHCIFGWQMFLFKAECKCNFYAFLIMSM